MQLSADVVIVGAGPAGLSLACSLADQPLRVMLVDPLPHTTLANPPEDGREIALTHLSIKLLKQLQVWPLIPASQIAPIRAARVLNGATHTSLDFDQIPPQRDALGYLVPNQAIRQALFQAVQHTPATLLCGQSATRIESDKQRARVTLSDGQVVDAALVVGADTRFSNMRRQMGISAHTQDFSRTAIVCRMQHERDHQHTAFECFRYGYTLALLPMNARCSSVVLTVNNRDAQGIMALADEAFNQLISERLHQQLGAMQLISKRHAYPLVAVHADRFISQRFALIGDAAVGMHPVTAHGFNLGLRGQALLARQIMQACRQGTDIGATRPLSRYQRQHRRMTAPLYHGTNLVVNLFTSESPAAKFMRSATLQLASHLAPVKQQITRTLTEDSLDPSPFTLPALPPVASTWLNEIAPFKRQ